MNTKTFGAIAIGVIAVGTTIAIGVIGRIAKNAKLSKTEAFVTKTFRDAGLKGELKFTREPEFTVTYTNYGETLTVAYVESVPQRLESVIAIIKLFEATIKKAA